MKKIFLIFLGLQLISFGLLGQNIDYRFPYNINNPDTSILLIPELEEISGIAIGKDPNVITAVEDENGSLYTFNTFTGKLISKKRFHHRGDYEDLAFVGDHLFVLKSNGSIYEVFDIGADTLARIKYKTPLNKQNNLEGLCFDKDHNQLLIACKGDIDNRYTDDLARGVYRFDLETKSLIPEPMIIITLEDFKSFIRKSKNNHLLEKFSRYLDAKTMKFAPSAIAIHPQTKNIYLISSRGKMLMVLNPKCKIIHLEKMDKVIHRQPEGMFFDKNGNLFISNEGKGGIPKIYMFKYNPR